MTLYDFIPKRKATRKYEMTPLSKEELSQIRQFADNLQPLYPDILIQYEIVGGVKSILSVKAPHYFIIYGENKEGYLENAGFMFQQMDLYLSSIGLGSCWLGMAKSSAEPQTKLPFIITLAFGKAAGSPYRELSEFKRKALSDISSGSDERLEAARLAPSAVNHQNWFFASADGKIDAYQKKAVIGLYDKMNKIDMGIALCHLFLATEQAGKGFVFAKEAGKEKKGYVYTGTVK